MTSLPHWLPITFAAAVLAVFWLVARFHDARTDRLLAEREKAAETAQSQQHSSPGAGERELNTSIHGHEVKILMDVYTNMHRRLEHYRQVAVTILFGFFALFSIIDNGLLGTSSQKYPRETAVLIAFLIVFIMLSSQFLLRRVHKNFVETSSVIQRVEGDIGMYDKGRLIANQWLLPASYPTADKERNSLEKRASGWQDDVIPILLHFITVIGAGHLLYVAWLFSSQTSLNASH